MSGKKSFYITTTLPYVNAEPHIGHAMEIIHADIVARWKQMQGHEVFFNTGTDEHGQKVWQKAQEEGKDVQEYVDGHANKFKELIKTLGISEDVAFIRTTDESHKKSAQEFWKKCEESGDIYKKNYKTKYCVGCELEKTDSELENGRCIIHPHKELEIREEENYFFRFSKYGEQLLALYDKGLILPDFRANEMRELIKRGLEDFSISRLQDKMPWGLPVPGDESHVMYVWFDALVNYISTLGWPNNPDNFKKFWEEGEKVQFAGKDQVRQQSAMWQAMLLSAGLPTTDKIVIHGFLNISGEKMSKSVGNVISPRDMTDRYGSDATRALLSGVNQFEDTDVNIGVPEEGFDLSYRSNLQDGLGNLVSRIMKLSEDYADKSDTENLDIYPEVSQALDEYKIQEALSLVWDRTRKLDGKIQSEKPWETKDKQVISELVQELGRIAVSLEAFMPNTSAIILNAIKENKKPENLFPRL